MSLSKTDLTFLVNIVSAGERPIGVLGLGVILYTGRNCSMFYPSVSLVLFKALFKVSTNLSVCPFDLGWNWGVVMWSTWYVLQKSLNSLDVNCVALSVTTQSTTPTRANSSCKNPIVQMVVGLLHCKVSGHFEWLSSTMRWYMLSMGPAKSTWFLCHGWSAFGYGLHAVVDFAASAHPLQDSLMSVMSLSMFGQYT